MARREVVKMAEAAEREMREALAEGDREEALTVVEETVAKISRAYWDVSSWLQGRASMIGLL